MTGLAFTKMHGLGNDFVVVDARSAPVALTDEQVRAVADRRTGIGFDQLLFLEPPTDGTADVFLRVRNADGSQAEVSGNGARCVAALLMDQGDTDEISIETVNGLLDAQAAGGGDVSLDMGPTRLDWRDIPLAEPVDTLHLGLRAGPLDDGAAVNVGNPHVVFFVDDVDAVPLEEVGPAIERHPMFPQFTNVEAARVLSPDTIRMRVWERGAGITRACGSGACATLVAAHRRGLTGRAADVVLDGGTLRVEWLKDDHVLLTGPAAVTFAGTIDASLLA